MYLNKYNWLHIVLEKTNSKLLVYLAIPGLCSINIANTNSVRTLNYKRSLFSNKSHLGTFSVVYKA